MSDIVRESPLVGLNLAERTGAEPADAGVVLAERPLLAYVNLRGDASEPRFLAGVRQVLGVDPPLEPNRVVAGDGLTAFWLGPDEWLVLGPVDEGAPETVGGLRRALEGLRSAVTDVSGYYTLIRVGGRHARDTLAKGCTLDLHPRELAPGRCAQTHVAKTVALIRPVEPPPAFEVPAFDLIVRRSFAEYLWLWLEDAGREWGVSVAAEASS